jgi:hypothetical protein
MGLRVELPPGATFDPDPQRLNERPSEGPPDAA